eukprot:gene25312-10968_t
MRPSTSCKSEEQKRISDLELDLAEKGRLLQDKGDEAEAAKRRIACLEHEVDGLLIKGDARQIQIDRLKAAAAEADLQPRRIYDLEKELADKGRLLQDKGEEAEVAKRRIACLEHEVDGLLINGDTRQIQIDRLKAEAVERDKQRRRISDLEKGLAEHGRLLKDKGEEADFAKRRIAGLEREVDGLLIKGDARQIQINRLKAEAVEVAEDTQRRRISDLAMDRELAELRRLLKDKGKEADEGAQRQMRGSGWSAPQSRYQAGSDRTDRPKGAAAAATTENKQRRRIADLERELAELKRLFQDKGKEAEAAKRRIEGLEREVGALLVKADVRKVETERLRKVETERLRVAAAAAGGGGNKQDKKIHVLELAMEKQRRVLEEKVRKAEAECNRLKICLDLKAKVRGESISLADVGADIQRGIASCPDPEAKKKMLKDLSMKWHPDKNPVMSSLATEVSKLINMLFRE